jgi:hypothetical protein
MTLKVEYFSEFEVIFEPALGYKSGDQVGLIHEKTTLVIPSLEHLGTGKISIVELAEYPSRNIYLLNQFTVNPF